MSEKKIEEIVTVKITFPKAKERAVKIWDLNWNTKLNAAIQKCLKTRRKVQVYRGDILYIVKPRYPLIKEAMAKKENKSLLKVSISVFTSAFHLGVREVVEGANV